MQANMGGTPEAKSVAGVQAQPNDNPLVVQRKGELLSYATSFYQKSWDWRSEKMHEKWDRCDRNYNAIYDPDREATKEPWQSTMFIDITFQNTEITWSQIFKTMMAPNPPIQTDAGPAGDELQARLIQDAVDYEMDKGQFKLAFYDGGKEAVKYGSGFVKFFWEREEDTRMRRTPVLQSPQEVIQGAPQEALTGQMPMPTAGIKGFQMTPQRVLLKNQLACRFIHIRDVFPEPNTKDWKRVIHRDKITYGEIVKQINAGQFFDVRAELENVTEGENFEADVQPIRNERGYFEMHREMAKFEKPHTVWEMHGAIPRKWIEFDIPDGDEAEELVPAKVMVASATALLSSVANTEFDGENPIIKFDYIRTGEPYGKGIPEIIFDDQDEINESGNLGIDNMNLILNKMIVVIESALVNPDEDIVSKPGGEIRLKNNFDDVKKVLMPLEFPDLAKSFFEHRFNLERMVQEKTGVNRVTLGSSGMVKDSNQTLGGMELLRNMFNERSASYGMIIEADFLIRSAHRIYGLIYQNLTPEDMKSILGEQPVQIGVLPIPGPDGMPMPHIVPRYAAFAFVPPEEVAKSYRFKPMGIFTLDNKITKAAQFMDWIKINAMVINPVEAAKYSGHLLGLGDELEKIILPMPLTPPGGQSSPSPNGGDKSDTPGAKGGPNGNQPSFMPPNPLRRQPVVSST